MAKHNWLQGSRVSTTEQVKDTWTAIAEELGLKSKANREWSAQALRGAGEDERYELVQVICGLLDRIEALTGEAKKPKKKS